MTQIKARDTVTHILYHEWGDLISIHSTPPLAAYFTIEQAEIVVKALQAEIAKARAMRKADTVPYSILHQGVPTE